MRKAIAFCATGKTGLGHLRRVTNIAHAVRNGWPDVSLDLLSNAAVGGLTEDEAGLYRNVEVVTRPQMAEFLAHRYVDLVVVDTAALPLLHRVEAPLCLVLRETMPAKLGMFRLDHGRPWDLIILPNPTEHWRPEIGVVPARRTEAVGWIYRRAPDRHDVQVLDSRAGACSSRRPVVLIASGGGGTDETASMLRKEVGCLIRNLRAAVPRPMEVVQSLGPRAPTAARIEGVDRVVTPGGRLHERFLEADLIISTAGYNSVLELASTDVPVLIIPISRSLDDQERRARQWGSRLGLCHLPGDLNRSALWMASVLETCRKRPVVDLGPSGANAAAALLHELLA